MTQSQITPGGYKLRPGGSLKAAAAKVLFSAGIDRAGDITGRSRSALYRYADSDEIAHHMPLDIAAAVTRETRDPAIAAYLAAEAGYVLAPVQDVKITAADLAGQIAALGQALARAFADYAAALSDGTLDDAERRRLLADLDQVVAVAMAARAGLAASLNQAGGL